MAIAELREAAGLLLRMPLLWVPGIVGGACAAGLWLVLFFSGSFFAARLVIVCALVLLFCITGMLAAIRDNGATGRTFLAGGLHSYFRVLLPLLLIGSFMLLVFFCAFLVFFLVGLGSDIAFATALSFGILIPTVILTLFADTAAVFEDRRVFESILRSVRLVSDHMGQVLSFLVVSALVCAGVVFGLMIVWEAILFDKLQPIMDFTDAQREAFTPDQLLAMIGQDGIWVTAAVLFLMALILIPLLTGYKACFYRKLAGSVKIEQVTQGEYDSKGRWYKY